MEDQMEDQIPVIGTRVFVGDAQATVTAITFTVEYDDGRTEERSLSDLRIL